MIDEPTMSVVIPVYQESTHLENVLEEIRRHVETLGASFELIVVDDGSSDDTWDVIANQAERIPELRAIRLSRNFGKEAALCAGLEAARGRAVATMDGDLQHPPAMLGPMYRLWDQGDVDLVEAVKSDRGREPITQSVGSRLFYFILNRFSGHDLGGSSDFKLMDRRVVDAWLTMGERNLFYRGMIAWLGFRRAEVRFEVPDRVGGSTRWSVFRLVRLAVTAVTAFSSLPMQIVTGFGAVFLLFSVVLGAQTLFNKLSGKAVSGFTTVILLQLLIGSLLMLSLGIIGEYISKLYREVKSRPRYVVQQRIDRP